MTAMSVRIEMSKCKLHGPYPYRSDWPEVCPRCLTPEYRLGDFVKFDRSKQDDGLFKGEGPIIDQIVCIDVAEDKDGRQIKYFFSNVDDWCLQENIIGRLVLEEKADEANAARGQRG